MNRFWAGGSDSSDSDSSSDDSSASSDSSDNKKNDNQWVISDEETDSEEEVRVVKSAKERTFESLENFITSIRNAMKIKDYAKIQSNFDDLVKNMNTSRSKSIIDSHGGVPRFFVKILCDLEDFIALRKKDKAASKKLSAKQGRSLNRMGLSLRKHNKQYEKLMIEYRANPGASSSEEESDDDEDSSDSDSDSDSSSSSSGSSSSSSSSSSVSVAKKKSSRPRADSDSSSSSSSSGSGADSAKSDTDSDDESEDWASSSDSEASSESEDDGYAELKGRSRWLKKVTVVKEKVKKDKEGRSEKVKKEKAERAARDAAAGVGTSTKSVIPEQNLTAAILSRKVSELVSSRGRKGTDAKFILRQLEALSRLAIPFGARVEIPILIHVITAQYDQVRTLDDYMDTPSWKNCASCLCRIVNILQDKSNQNSKQYILTMASSEGGNDLMIGNLLATAGSNKIGAAASGMDDAGAMEAVAADVKLTNPETGEYETADERAERLRVEKEARMSDEDLLQIPVNGSLSLLVTRLDEEYMKSLQQISPYSAEYVIRLRDEAKLVELLKNAHEYFVRVASKSEAAEISLLRVEHLYYRHNTISEQVDRAATFYETYGEATLLHPSCIAGNEINGLDFTKSHPGAACGTPCVPELKSNDSGKLINDLCTYIYQHGTERSRTRAILCHIFHHALHNRFLDARDLLLMSHLQDNITNVGDVSTMILFNRMMVTLGLAAFREGKIWEAHQCLSEICSGRVRELLAQGIVSGRFFSGEKSAEQEKAEKRRQIPYHQHINLDLLEACHLISAMLLEVPNMAANGDDLGTRRGRVLSRTFRKYNDIYERQVFTGPPEQTRDFVMRATKSLMKGDWKACADLLIGLDVWKLVPGEKAVEQLQSMLFEKIKLEGLRTYLFAFSSQYDSLSLKTLCKMFDLCKNEVHSVVSKMMINYELHASWDQPTETIVLRQADPSSLQLLALQFADKASSLVDSNERLLDAKTGNYGYRDSEGKWKSGEHQGRGNYHNRGGRGGHQQGGRGGRTYGRGGRGGRDSGGRGGRGGYNKSNRNHNRQW